MNIWTVTLHPQAEPELTALPADMQARFVHMAELLQEFGPQRVGLPHIRPLEGKLCKAVTVSPAPCMPPFQGRRLLVLHVFVKKTQTTPRSALETARKRLETTT